MRKALPLVFMVCLALGLVTMKTYSAPAGATLESVKIVISPHTLCRTATRKCVTVHTNIPYGAAELDTIELSGIPVWRTKSDDRGNLVAKFHHDDVVAIIPEDDSHATLTLTGIAAGVEFAGSDTIRVRG